MIAIRAAVVLSIISSSFCAVYNDLTFETRPVTGKMAPTIISSLNTTKPIAIETTASSLTPPVTEPSTTTTSSTIKPTTSTTAPTTTSTAAPTTTSTVAPITTSTAAPTTTSTAAPTTTSTVAPITTPPPAPTPAPSPEAGMWYVREGNVTCVVAKMLINVNVTYPAHNVTKNVVLSISGNINGTQANGSCSNTTQTVEIPFTSGHNLTIFFTHNATANKFAVSDITLTLNSTALPEFSDNVTNLVYGRNDSLFTTPLSMSYKCNKPQTVNLTYADNFVAVLNISQTQLEAFRSDEKIKFGDAQDCEPLDVPDLVPIAVGVSLGVMIVVVLVAYLIGRRRSQNRGYVSM